MRFGATIELRGKIATGFDVPAEVVAAFVTGKRPPVVVRIEGHPYRSTVSVYGGVFMLPLNARNRAAAGVAAGDEVEVELELDTEPRTVEVPPDMASALGADPAIRQRFDALSYGRRREAVEAVLGAKRDTTRQRRIAATVDALRDG